MNTQGALIKAYAKQLKLPTLFRYEEVLRLTQAQGVGIRTVFGGNPASRSTPAPRKPNEEKDKECSLPLKQKPGRF